MIEKVFELEHRPGEEWVFHLRPGMMRCLPEATTSHIYAAQKEGLLAIRGLIDCAIERLDEEGKDERKGRTKIEIK